jgi:hypothetical protein
MQIVKGFFLSSSDRLNGQKSVHCDDFTHRMKLDRILTSRQYVRARLCANNLAEVKGRFCYLLPISLVASLCIQCETAHTTLEYVFHSLGAQSLDARRPTITHLRAPYLGREVAAAADWVKFREALSRTRWTILIE